MTHEMNSHLFKVKIKSALSKVRQLLHEEKEPKIPDEVDHSYEDKYRLAEMLTSAAVSSGVQSLESLGFSIESIAKMGEWAKTGSVTIKCSTNDTVTFIEEKKIKMQSSESFVTKGIFSSSEKSAVSTISEFFWQYERSFNISAFAGTGVETDSDGSSKTCIGASRETTITLKTKSKLKPNAPPPLCGSSREVEAQWLLNQIEPMEVREVRGTTI